MAQPLLDEVKELVGDPDMCPAGFAWLKGLPHDNPARAWKDCHNAYWMIRLLARMPVAGMDNLHAFKKRLADVMLQLIWGSVPTTTPVHSRVRWLMHAMQDLWAWTESKIPESSLIARHENLATWPSGTEDAADRQQGYLAKCLLCVTNLALKRSPSSEDDEGLQDIHLVVYYLGRCHRLSYPSGSEYDAVANKYELLADELRKRVSWKEVAMLLPKKEPVS